MYIMLYYIIDTGTLTMFNTMNRCFLRFHFLCQLCSNCLVDLEKNNIYKSPIDGHNQLIKMRELPDFYNISNH